MAKLILPAIKKQLSTPRCYGDEHPEWNSDPKNLIYRQTFNYENLEDSSNGVPLNAFIKTFFHLVRNSGKIRLLPLQGQPDEIVLEGLYKELKLGNTAEIIALHPYVNASLWNIADLFYTGNQCNSINEIKGFHIICDRSNNTPEVVAEKDLIADIKYTYRDSTNSPVKGFHINCSLNNNITVTPLRIQ